MQKALEIVKNRPDNGRKKLAPRIITKRYQVKMPTHASRATWKTSIRVVAHENRQLLPSIQEDALVWCREMDGVPNG